jgi:hypothetical protein
VARIRTIKPEFWTSEQIVDCSRDARLLFIGLWNHCDSNGVMPLNLRSIKMKVFPGDDDVFVDDSANTRGMFDDRSTSVRRLIDELRSAELITFYTVDNTQYLLVTGFKAHQRIDNEKAKYPPPDTDDPPAPPGIEPDNPPPTLRTIVERSTKEGKGRERKGKEESDSRQPLAQYSNSRTARATEPSGRAALGSSTSEQSEAKPPTASGPGRAEVAALSERVMAAAEVDHTTHSGWHMVGTAVSRWLGWGADPELIVSVVEARARQRAAGGQGKPSGPNWFDGAIRDEIGRAKAESPPGRPANGGSTGAEIPGDLLIDGEPASGLCLRKLPDRREELLSIARAEGEVAACRKAYAWLDEAGLVH